MHDDLFDEFTFYPEQRLRESSLSSTSIEFLSRVGLPTWAAPNMHFGEMGGEWALLPIIDVGTNLYLGLGEDRDDSPIGIDLSTESIWVIPKNKQPLFMAKNAPDLSLALHIFQSCINAAVGIDSSACVRNRVPMAHIQPFISWAKIKDPMLMGPNSFWHYVLLRLCVPN